jgi:hypothetical protein
MKQHAIIITKAGSRQFSNIGTVILYFIIAILSFVSAGFSFKIQKLIRGVTSGQITEKLEYFRLPLHLIAGIVAAYWGIMVAFKLTRTNMNSMITGTLLTLVPIFPVEIAGLVLILNKIFITDTAVSLDSNHRQLYNNGISGHCLNFYEDATYYMKKYIFATIGVIAGLSLLTVYPMKNIVRYIGYGLTVAGAIAFLIYLIIHNTKHEVNKRCLGDTNKYGRHIDGISNPAASAASAKR